MATMKAVRIHDFGGPEVVRFETLTVPQPMDDELLLRVEAVSVNPVDYKTREGKYPRVGRDDLPVTLGRDLSGSVEAWGSYARTVKRGDAMYGMIGPERGALAEYVVVKATEVAPKPDSLDHAQAAAVPLAALTAWQGLFEHGELQSGQRVLIHGGAGGVGHFAVQFAKNAGATVLTTVSARDADFVRGLGADQVIDYANQRFEDEAGDVDMVFDLIAGETQERSWKVIRPGGVLVSTLGSPPQDKAAEHDVRGVGFMVEPSAAQLSTIGELIDAGRVRPVVQQTFAFADAVQAEQRHQDGHVQGKIVIDLAA